MTYKSYKHECISDRHEFICFLKKKHIYERFIANFKKRHPNISFKQYCEKTQMDRYVNNAFGWSSTIEGHRFWKSINDEWVNDCYFEMLINPISKE